MEQTVNTMTITLDEYKRMIDEVSNLQAKLAVKDETIKNLHKELGVLQTTIANLEAKATEEEVTIYVENRRNDYYSRSYSNGVRLSKESPELVEIIKNSIDQTMEDTIKEQERKIDVLQNELDNSYKTSNKNKTKLIEKQEAEVKELQDRLNSLTEDYENLKLDKAANLVEAERLEEINRLNEQIVALEVSKDKETIIWPRGLFSTLFHKQIARAADTLFEQYKARKDWREVNKTSAYGKAKDYLKTLNEPVNSFYYYGSHGACTATTSW